MPKLKPLYLDTPLVQNGAAVCSILVPDEPRYTQLGGELAAAIEAKLGARPRVTSSPTTVDPTRETVIALGQMNNNKLLERLYWNHYIYLDSAYPGNDGYVIETIHNPYPYTAGHNIVALGGSTYDGVARAVHDFTAMLPAIATSGVLPRTWKVVLPPPAERATNYLVEGKTYTHVTLPAHDLTPAEAKALTEADPPHTLLAFQEQAQRYLVTGEEPYLQAAKNVLETVTQDFDTTPNRVLLWPEETNSRFIFAAWDAVEEAPVFNDAERLRYTNMLLRFLYSLQSHVNDYGNLAKNQTIVWNHTTFPLMGLYWGGRYFRRYYNVTAMDEYLEAAAGAFRGQEKSWKPQEDADSYLTLTMSHTIEYALAEDKMTFFTNGNIRKYADYLIGITDNRGWAPGFGDSGIIRATAIPDAGVPWAFWYTRDPKYLGYLQAIHGGHWLNPFDQSVVPAPPLDQIGIREFPLDPLVYEYTIHQPYYSNEPGFDPPNIPLAQAFDKIAFRENLDPLGQYFVMDGYSRGKHLHYDGNAILKLCDKGIDWLVDGDYLVRNTTEHNMISVVRNGRSDKLEPVCTALLHQADFPRQGFVQTTVQDYNGVDWYRSIFWTKGGPLVVLDRLQAREPGNYKFDCVWKCIDSGSEELLDPHRFRISRIDKDGERDFSIVNADGASQTVSKRLGSSGPMKYLWQRRGGQLQAKQESTFANLLYLNDVGQHHDYSLHPIAGTHAVVAGFDRPTLLGTGPLNTQGLHIDAAMYQLSDDTLYLVDATSLSTSAPIFTASTPVSIEVDWQQATATVINTQPAHVELLGAAPVDLQPGTHILKLASSAIEPHKPSIASLQSEPYASQSPTAPSRDASHASSPSEARSDIQSKPTAAQALLPARGGVGGGVLHELWRLAEPTLAAATQPLPEIRDYTVATLNADDKPSLLVCRGNDLQCYDGAGNLQWHFTAAKPVRCVTTGDLHGNGKTEVLCGGDDKLIHVLDAGGHEIASHMMIEKLIVGEGGTVDGFVNNLVVADLFGDGKKEIVAGCTNSQISAFDANLKRLWNRGAIYHGVRKIVVADLDGDGKKEVLAADHYGAVVVISADGKTAHSAYTEIGDVTFDVGNTDGSGKLTVVNGSSSGALTAFEPGEILKPLWSFDNFGYAAHQVLLADLDGDGKSETLVASDTGYLYALDGAGKTRWQTDLSSGVTAIAIVHTPTGNRIVTGEKNGNVTLLDLTGHPLATYQLQSPIKLLKSANLQGNGPDQILALDESNHFVVLGL